MKIGIDITPGQNNPAGIGQYTNSLISKLVELDKVNEYFTFSSTPMFFPHTKNVVIKWPRSLPFKGIRWMINVSSYAKKHNLDLFISPSNHLFSKLFPRTIQFIHDLGPVKYPQFFSRKGSYIYGKGIQMSARNAWQLVTVSQTVKKEIQEYCNKDNIEIKVIYPALNPWIVAPPKEINPDLNLPAEYILAVGTLEPRKNYLNLIKGFDRFLKDYSGDIKLLIAGKKGWQFDQIFKLVKELNLEEKVVFLGYVANEDLANIYANASASVYLSLYEGFGIPPLEALYFNLPVLVSDIPLFHEIYADKVSYTDAENPANIAQAIGKLITEPIKETKEWVNRTYSWEKSAGKLLAIINSYAQVNKQI